MDRKRVDERQTLDSLCERLNDSFVGEGKGARNSKNSRLRRKAGGRERHCAVNRAPPERALPHVGIKCAPPKRCVPTGIAPLHAERRSRPRFRNSSE